MALWIVVSLWCPRELAKERLIARGARDVVDRLIAWDQTEQLPHADMTINTADLNAEAAAEQIHDLVVGVRRA